MLIGDQEGVYRTGHPEPAPHRTTAPPSGGRILGTVAVVLVASLGSVYLLGRALGDDDATSRPTTAGAGQVGTVPDEMATSAATPPAPSPTAGPARDGEGEGDTQGRPPLPSDPNGPFGSRQTTGTSRVALTFDDGPDPTYTPRVLALLRRYQVKATFCLVGENVRAHPDLVRAIVADGHTLCNHSWSHDLRLGSRPTVTILADLLRTNRAIQAAVPGVEIRYFRQPGGNWTARVVSTAAQLGMTSLDWAVDPRDWAESSPARIAATVTGQTTAGDIVLMHDGGGNRAATATALEAILSTLTNRVDLAALPTRPDPSDQGVPAPRPS
jgi:peptidoglycan/xylan/chitin deacetylase (PgdA/CDA1 family)